MQTPRLYGDLAHLWPILSPPDHYVPEAEILRAQIDRAFGTERERKLQLLELGVGGGHTLVHLAPEFDVTGVDLSPQMLRNCADLVPGARLVQGDMRSVRLGSRFDVVLLHDAADYLLSRQDVRAALETMAAHLRPGGLGLVAPTYDSETFEPHQTEHDEQSSPDGSLHLAYLSYVHDPDPSDHLFEMVLVYVINDHNHVEVIEDRHTCGLFSRELWLEEMHGAGIAAEIRDEEVWTLFAGRRV
jgi:hypothetical protein